MHFPDLAAAAFWSSINPAAGPGTGASWLSGPALGDGVVIAAPLGAVSNGHAVALRRARHSVKGVQTIGDALTPPPLPVPTISPFAHGCASAPRGTGHGVK